MQQLLVVLAVHLMTVVAIGLGRAAPGPHSTSTPAPLRPPPHHKSGQTVLDPLSAKIMSADQDADSRRERSLGVWKHVKPQKFLTNKHGWTVEINLNGTVTATRDPKPRYGILQTEGVSRQDLGLSPESTMANVTSHFGKVAILGFHSNRYLCMGKRGKIYTRHSDLQIKNFSQECVFVEKMHETYYYTYCSFTFPTKKKKLNGKERKSKRKWCLGINSNGTVRLGKKTKDSQVFAQFTPRPTTEQVTPLPRPAETTRPVHIVTAAPPAGSGIKSPTESPKKHNRRSGKRRRRMHRNRNKDRESKECTGPGGLFNLCRDNTDVITDVTELKRKSSRRQSRGRSRNSNKRRKDRNKKTSSITTIGLFTG